MQAPSPEQYARLGELADAWTRCHLEAARSDPRFNPRLVADALCFQRHDGQLLGALITPLSLSLVLLPGDATPPPPDEQEARRVTLPSGEYGFRAERLGEIWLWRCELLDDLSDVASREAGSRLAQRLMERVMTPARCDG